MGKVIDLDALTNPAALPTVRLFGREMPVQPLSGAAAHKLAVVQDADPSGSAMLGALLEILASLLPTTTAEERGTLSIEQVSAIVQLARGQVADVEQMLATQQAAQSGAAEGNV